MSALVVVLKQFSPFSAGDKEIDLSTLPPPPAPEELHPMFMGEPSLTPFLSSKRSPSHLHKGPVSQQRPSTWEQVRLRRNALQRKKEQIKPYAMHSLSIHRSNKCWMSPVVHCVCPIS